MIDLDDELAVEYLTECREHLAAARVDLLATWKGRAEMSEELVNRVLHAVHLVRGAGLFGLVKVRDLALAMEDALGLLRLRKMVAMPHRLGVLVRAADALYALLERPAASNRADIAEVTAAGGEAMRGSPGLDRGIPRLGPATEAGTPSGCVRFWWRTISPARCCCRLS